jgi:HSP20 family protein
MFAIRNTEPLASFNTISQIINHLELGESEDLFMWSNSEEVIVQAELPGFRTDDVEVEIEGRLLYIGLTENLCDSEDDSHEQFTAKLNEHRVRLPFNVNVDSVEAKMDNGVLEVRLPRVESERPRKIEINN